MQKWPVFNEDRAIGRGFERVSALRFGIVGSAVVHGGGRTDDADDAVEERLQLEVQGGGVDGARQAAGDALHVAQRQLVAVAQDRLALVVERVAEGAAQGPSRRESWQAARGRRRPGDAGPEAP